MFRKLSNIACAACLAGLVSADAAHAARTESRIAAPTNLSAQVVAMMSSQGPASPVLVQLTWNDNSTGETFHKVEYRKSSRDAWQVVAERPGNAIFATFHLAAAEAAASGGPMVTGEVRVRLYKGRAEAIGRRSPRSLYRQDLATFGTGMAYDHADAAGFIRLYGLPERVRALTRERVPQEVGE